MSSRLGCMGLCDCKGEEIHITFYGGPKSKFYHGLFWRRKGEGSDPVSCQTIRGIIRNWLLVKYYLNRTRPLGQAKDLIVI